LQRQLVREQDKRTREMAALVVVSLKKIKIHQHSFPIPRQFFATSWTTALTALQEIVLQSPQQW
jgi:hypothetical protein